MSCHHSYTSRPRRRDWGNESSTSDSDNDSDDQRSFRYRQSTEFEGEFDAREIINMRAMNRYTDREDYEEDDYQTASESEQWPRVYEPSILEEFPVNSLNDEEEFWWDPHQTASERWPEVDGIEVNIDTHEKETEIVTFPNVEAGVCDWEEESLRRDSHDALGDLTEKTEGETSQIDGKDTGQDCVQKRTVRHVRLQYRESFSDDDDRKKLSGAHPAVKRKRSRGRTLPRSTYSATVQRKSSRTRSRSRSRYNDSKDYRRSRQVFKRQKRSKSKREPKCSNCLFPNHVVENCMGFKRCDFCKRNGHATDLCWYRLGKRGRETTLKNVEDDLLGKRDCETTLENIEEEEWIY